MGIEDESNRDSESLERTPSALLERAGFSGDPDQDQHFLMDDRVLDRVIQYAIDANFDLSEVLEIGGGTGALTARLLENAAHVTTIERDRRLVSFLESEFSDEIDDGSLTIRPDDALTVGLGPFSCAIGNLPYGVASQVLFRLFKRERPIIAMVQREFAERLVAEAGTSEYGRVTVTARSWASIECCEIVPSSAFEPEPAVESAIIRCHPDPAPIDDRDAFEAVVRAVFTQRRKTLRNAIRNTVHISGVEDSDSVLETLDGALLDRRPGTLTPTEYVDLVDTMLEVTTIEGGQHG